jgi:hypothetical protein
MTFEYYELEAVEHPRKGPVFVINVLSTGERVIHPATGNTVYFKDQGQAEAAVELLERFAYLASQS